MASVDYLYNLAPCLENKAHMPTMCFQTGYKPCESSQISFCAIHVVPLSEFIHMHTFMYVQAHTCRYMYGCSNNTDCSPSLVPSLETRPSPSPVRACSVRVIIIRGSFPSEKTTTCMYGACAYWKRQKDWFRGYLVPRPYLL